MILIFNFPTISNLPKIPKSPTFRSIRSCDFCVQRYTMPPPSSSSSTKMVAEYAKSNRSSCKKCSKTIDSKALRLGLVSRDARGFDMTKWHHLGCFSFGLESVASAEQIKGFDSLKSSDQKALQELLAACDKTKEVDKQDEDEENQQVERISKKSKLSNCDEEYVDIAFSVSDVQNKYKDATLSPKWKAFQTVIFLERDDGLNDSSKIAAFDFDGCLANTSVKRVGPDAWSLMYPSIPDKLRSLYNDGYKLVIFTNESNIERWKNKRQVAVDSKIGRLNNFIETVKVPIQVFIACGLSNSYGVEDPFRKPKKGMWYLMERHFNSGISIDMDQSFYVGDAAGRDGDHSGADIKFAQVGTPEKKEEKQGRRTRRRRESILPPARWSLDFHTETRENLAAASFLFAAGEMVSPRRVSCSPPARWKMELHTETRENHAVASFLLAAGEIAPTGF